MPTTSHPSRLAAALAVAAALGVAPPAATAATTSATKAANRTQIALDGPAAARLRAAGVRIDAARPGSATRTRITLPASGLMIQSARDLAVTHKPVLTFRAGARTLRLTVPQLVVDGARSTIAVGVGARTVTLLSIATTSATRTIDSARGRLTFKAAPVSLTAAGAALLRERLGLRGLRAGRLGRLTSDVDVTVSGMPPLASLDGPPTPGGAAPTAPPAGARAIVGGTVTYAPKASFLGYVAQQGEGASAEDGATFVGEKASGSYRLPITGGWYDPATRAAVLQTAGTMRFRFIGHQIDVALSDWAFDLASTPKGVALLKACLHCTILRQGNVGSRLPVLLAKTRGVVPTIGADGATVSWPAIPMTLANEGVPLFLAYPYDSDEGSLSLTAVLG